MGFFKQIITVICGFVLPRYLLSYYGSSINGLVTSITHFLSFISLLDMGVGAVVQANLYKPLADGDHLQVSRIIKSSERFFRRLAYIFLAYIAVLCCLYPTVINRDYEAFFSITLLLIIAISTFAQYLFGMTYQLLLNADQRAYVQLSMQIATVVLNTVFSIVLMKLGAGIHIVKLMTAAVFVLRPFGQMLYVKKRYRLDRKIKLEGEPIKQKWNGFSQHLASVICQNIDVAVLTMFSTLENVSVYSVYFNVTNGVQQIIMTAATGLESTFGNMIAKNEKDQLIKAFSAVEWVIHAGVTVIFSIAAITIVPFISVYTNGINDADYIAPAFGMLLVGAYAALCLRIPYFRVIKAAGHFKQTQNGAYISAVINIAVTVALVFKFGLIGAALGTLCAMLYHTCYFVWYLKRNILERSVKYFLLYLLSDCAVAAVSWFLTRGFEMHAVTYPAWIVLAVKVSAVVVAVAAVLNALLFRGQIKNMLALLKKKTTRAQDAQE